MDIKVALIQPAEPFGPMGEMLSSIIGLAAILRESGIDVSIIDARLDNLTVDETIRRLEGRLPDVVGITGLNNPYRFIKDFCFELKRKYPQIPIMAGGPFISTQPGCILPRVPIDVACTGEGDEIVVELVRRLVRRESLEGLHNVAWMDADGTLRKGECRMLQDLDTLPFPAYDLLDMPRYLTNNVEYFGKFYFPLPTGRGCIHHCYYCGRPYDKVRRPSTGWLLELMDSINEKYGVSHFLFYDDGGLYPREWIMGFCDALLEHGRGYRFGMSACPEHVEDDVVARLKEAGCDFLSFGVEHFSPEIQKGFFRVRQSKYIEQAFSVIQRHGIYNLSFNLLWGHPDDTDGSFRDAYKMGLEYTRRFDLPHFWMAGLVVFPNSKFHEDVLKRDAILDYEDYMYASDGYGPYVNVTSEDDDIYRSFIAERRLLNDLDLARAEFDLLSLGGSPDITRLTGVQTRIDNLSKAVLILKQLMALPKEKREPFRDTLELVLDVPMYDRHKNYYRELACIPGIVDLSEGTGIAVYHTASFAGEALVRLFASIRTAGLDLKAFVDFAPADAGYEGYPCIHPNSLPSIDADVLIVPESASGRALVESRRASRRPSMGLLNIGDNDLKRPPWGRPGLTGGYYSPSYWEPRLEPEGVSRKFQLRAEVS